MSYLSTSMKSGMRSMTRLGWKATRPMLAASMRVPGLVWHTMPDPLRARLLDTILGPEDLTEYVSETSAPMPS